MAREEAPQAPWHTLWKTKAIAVSFDTSRNLSAGWLLREPRGKRASKRLAVTQHRAFDLLWVPMFYIAALGMCSGIQEKGCVLETADPVFLSLAPSLKLQV